MDTYSIIDNSLGINETYNTEYECYIPNHISDAIEVSAKIRIRPFKPQLIIDNPTLNEFTYLLENLPVFDINSSIISSIIYIYQ